MKRFYYTRLREEKLREVLETYPGFAEERQSHEDVLKEIDRLLKPHKLEIHLAITGDTSTLFKIERR